MTDALFETPAVGCVPPCTPTAGATLPTQTLGTDPGRADPVLEIHVVGVPAPQGSKRHIGNGVMIESSSKRLKPWRQDVKQAALDALELATLAGAWTGPLHDCDIDITFLMPRPRGHYRTGRFADQLRPDAPTRHTSRPDGDKLLRGTLDALKVAQVYVDDANVVDCAYRKHYTSGHTGAVIRLYSGDSHV